MPMRSTVTAPTATRLVDRLLALSAAGTINLIVPKRVRQEIVNPSNPAYVREAALPKIFTIGVSLNSGAHRRKRIIAQKLQGIAQPGRPQASADPLFQPTKNCGGLVTS